MSPLPMIQDPGRSEEILESLSREADRLVFNLYYGDVRVYQSNVPALRESVEETQREHRAETVIHCKLIARVRAFKGRREIFDAQMPFGETKELLEFKEEQLSDADARSFADYVDLLCRERHIDPIPRIVVNDKEY